MEIFTLETSQNLPSPSQSYTKYTDWLNVLIYINNSVC